MGRVPPSELVESLDPPSHAVLKREPGTLVWRESGRNGEGRVAKLYRRRGPWNALRWKLTRSRAEREYLRLRYLTQAGVRCTEALAWASGYSRDHGHHELLLMRDVPGAVQLGDHVREQGSDVDLAPLFVLVRRMHESGFLHQTLYVRNVLVDPSSPPGEEYLISDVPRSLTFPRSIAESGMALWDLLDLSWGLKSAGVAPGAIPCQAYGLGKRARMWLDRRRGIDPCTKRRRLLRDGRARLRCCLARFTESTGGRGPGEGSTKPARRASGP